MIAVFQPHLYSRTREFAEKFAEALLEAEVAVVLPIYAARESPIAGVTSQLIVDGASRLGHTDVRMIASTEDLFAMLDEHARAGDVLMTIGAGDVNGVAEKWLGVES